MNERFDIIAQLPANAHTDWVPFFPQETDWVMVDGAEYLVTEIMVSNVSAAQATFSIAYGLFAGLPLIDDLIDDNIRFNAIPLDAYDTITLSVKWPFRSSDHRMLFKCGTASAMTVIGTGIVHG